MRFTLLTHSLAINIMATFVHNEPTSLSIIQEAGLPESFYKAIETGIEPSIEVLSFLLCLLSSLKKVNSGPPIHSECTGCLVFE